MTPRDLRNIHTTGNSCRDALPYANMPLKLPPYFYLMMEKPHGHYFQVQSPYYQAAQCNQKMPKPYPEGDRSDMRKPKKKKDKNQHKSQLPPAFISLSQSQLI